MPENSKRMGNTTVVIVGAGICGLYAAKELLSGSFQVMIIEARDRTGGRIWTDNKKFKMPVDLGAEFLHGNPPLSLKMIKKLGVETQSAGNRFLEIRNDRVHNPEFDSKVWDKLISDLKKLDHDMPFQTFFDSHFPDEKYSAFRNSVFNLIEGYDAADPQKISAYALRDEWQENDDQSRIVNRYGSLVQHLENEIVKQGGKIVFEEDVSTITCTDDEVMIATAKREYKADKVIVTVPISVLQQRRISFTPLINGYMNAADDIGFGGVIKFLFEFKSRFWYADNCRANLKEFDFILSDAKIPTWWTQTEKESTLLTGWVAGPAALSLAKENLFEAAIDSLVYIFKRPASEIRSLVQKSQIVNWNEDPFSLGAYAYATPASHAAREILTTPVANRIYFAGEALSKNNTMGTVEAALQSAEVVVQKINQ